MEWSHYLASFFAGLFLANFVPHFVSGISGDKFPSPFAKPPGKGLSSPTVNVIWGLLNLVIGFLLFRAGHLAEGDNICLTIFFAGIALISITMSKHFSQKHNE